MSSLSSLSLVTPTYNRQRFALRSMRFWSGKGAHVIMIDGSSQPIPQEHLAGVADNVRYMWMPISLEERLRAATQLLDTEYVALLADDEFFLPNGLQRCIDELESREDVIACVGRCLNFWATKRRLTVSHRYMSWPSILQESAQERMEAKMATLHALTIYGVVRRDPWVNCIRLVTEKVFSCCYVTEHLFELFSSYQGKSRVIDVLSWFRSGENHPTSFKGWNRDYHFEHWYREQRNAAEISEMFDIIKKSVLSVTPGTDQASLDHGLRKAIDILVNRAEAGKTRVSKIIAPFRKCAYVIAANLPKKVKYPLKHMLGLSRNEFPFEEIPERLKQVGISCDAADLMGVKESLKQFYGSW
ncbi:MAG: TIGR00180 family glycosyltransferase [Deltaproteobacteria bacterium]|nr:TIGR00180 family glycosyltransferase [Deltaproteobacteria bacterium]